MRTFADAVVPSYSVFS